METERLIIDEIRESDKEDYFYNISHDKKVLETFICKYVEDIKDFDFSPYLANKNIYAIRLKSTNKLIGIINENGRLVDGKIDLSIALSPEYQGQGLAKEALQGALEEMWKLNYNEVSAYAFADNLASINVLEAVGMQKIDREEEMDYRGQKHKVVFYTLKK